MGTRHPSTPSTEAKGVTRLGLGAWLGLFAALLAILLPSSVLFLGAYGTAGLLSLTPTLLAASGALVLAGALLFVLSLFLYRRAFAALRRADSRFNLPSFLCLVGSLGFVLILVAASIVAGSAAGLLTCLHGQPAHALACLEQDQPLGAYAALIGFALGWVGGLGIVLGLWEAGRHYRNRAVDLGSVLYLALLFLVLAPLVELAVPFPAGQYALLVVLGLSVAAPASVLVGALSEGVSVGRSVA